MKTKENESDSESQRAKATNTQTERVAEASSKWRFSVADAIGFDGGNTTNVVWMLNPQL